VLSTVGQCLGLPETALEASRSILAEHGNMSSPTVLFILERLLAQGAPLPCLCLAFGPGLVAEAALIT
jgi:predicted naringenin-chalcone synthase